MPQGRTKTKPSLSARGTIYTADDVASVLSVSRARVVWHCEAAARVGRASFFFGCWQESGEWMIPERTLRRALGCIVHQHYTVAEVASLTGFSEWTIRDRLCVVPAGMAIESTRAAHQLGARLFFGTDVRVPGTELDRLAAGLVTRLPQPSTTAAA